MAERVSTYNYENMINALRTGARNIYTDAADLLRYASVCASALGDSDNAVPQILEEVQRAQQKYTECVERALAIANAMQEELDNMKRENDVWGNN